jgi:hypothetical protein
MATSPFSKAFAEARKAGDKTFTFGGKKFTTETKEEASKKAGSAVTDKYMKLRDAPAGADTTKMRDTADRAARSFTGFSRDVDTGDDIGRKAASYPKPKDTSRAQAAGAQFAKVAKAEASAPKGASEATRKAMSMQTAEAKRKYESESKYAKGGMVRGQGAVARTKKCKVI